MGRTACTEPQCLYKGAVYLFFYTHSEPECYRIHLSIWNCTDMYREFEEIWNEVQFRNFQFIIQIISMTHVTYSRTSWYHHPQGLPSVLPLSWPLVRALRLCTGRTAHRGIRGIALHFHDHGTRRGWGVSVTTRPIFTPGKHTVPIVQKAGWAPGPVWIDGENLAPHQDSISGLSSP